MILFLYSTSMHRTMCEQVDAYVRWVDEKEIRQIDKIRLLFPKPKVRPHLSQGNRDVQTNLRTAEGRHKQKREYTGKLSAVGRC